MGRRAQPVIEASEAKPAVPPVAPRLVGYVADSRLAELLDCSESTVWDYARQGILPKPYHIGGLTRWKWSEVELMIEGRRGPGQEEDPILKASRGR